MIRFDTTAKATDNRQSATVEVETDAGRPIVLVASVLDVNGFYGQETARLHLSPERARQIASALSLAADVAEGTR